MNFSKQLSVQNTVSVHFKILYDQEYQIDQQVGSPPHPISPNQHIIPFRKAVCVSLCIPDR